MIQIDYTIPVTGGAKAAEQKNSAQNVILDQGELAMLGLTIVPGSDVTTLSALLITRQIQFNETADFLLRVGFPVTAAKRTMFVKHLFDYKLTQRLRKKVGETISLF